jgi:hypothetical protein
LSLKNFSVLWLASSVKSDFIIGFNVCVVWRWINRRVFLETVDGGGHCYISLINISTGLRKIRHYVLYTEREREREREEELKINEKKQKVGDCDFWLFCDYWYEIYSDVLFVWILQLIMCSSCKFETCMQKPNIVAEVLRGFPLCLQASTRVIFPNYKSVDMDIVVK